MNSLITMATAEGDKLEIPIPYSSVKFITEKNLLNDWQETWDGYDSESGRRTRDFVPKVNGKFLVFSKYLIFFLSGHGPFPYYLNRFKKLNSSSCPCGSIGDVDHYVFRCQRFPSEGTNSGSSVGVVQKFARKQSVFGN
ncbi:hypothetical protein AVEN_5689-1 [Araneus ventricosus]|uniref:Reverse transcriptase zinc-binding domain-containing protein n=1 Tax=Araneus ventricosus TaxID=182803 RepID=A0A4Y2DX37_ARAVE|nr:hypothetical protein AVEN_5689-1 [Araneus ventricosus]